MKIISLVVLSLVLVVVGSSAATLGPEDKLIVPGERIGKWTLAMTVDELVRLQGPAIRLLGTAGISPHADAVHDSTLFYWHRIPVGAIAFGQQKRVDALITGVAIRPESGGEYKTDRAIGFQSTRADVLKTYGQPTAVTVPQPQEARLIYDALGIALWFDVGGRLRSVTIFRKGTASRYWHLL